MYDELIKRLREHVEWAKDSEYETPITLSDDLGKAIETIEALKHDIERYVKINTDLLNEQPKWISVEERLPEKPDWYPNCQIRRT